MKTAVSYSTVVLLFLRSLYEQKSQKGNHILIEALSDPDATTVKRRKVDIEVTGVSSLQFQAAANCWELLHSNEVISREFVKLANQLQVKPWAESFSDDLALYQGRYDETKTMQANNLASNIMRVSVNFFLKKYALCVESILAALPQLPSVEECWKLSSLLEALTDTFIFYH